MKWMAFSIKEWRKSIKGILKKFVTFSFLPWHDITTPISHHLFLLKIDGNIMKIFFISSSIWIPKGRWVDYKIIKTDKKRQRDWKLRISSWMEEWMNVNRVFVSSQIEQQKTEKKQLKDVQHNVKKLHYYITQSFTFIRECWRWNRESLCSDWLAYLDRRLQKLGKTRIWIFFLWKLEGRSCWKLTVVGFSFYAFDFVCIWI